jgi:hypothetical protein
MSLNNRLIEEELQLQSRNASFKLAALSRQAL